MIARIVAALGGLAIVGLAGVLASRDRISPAVAAGIVGGTVLIWAIAHRPPKPPAGGESACDVAPSNRRPGNNPPSVDRPE